VFKVTVRSVPSSVYPVIFNLHTLEYLVPPKVVWETIQISFPRTLYTTPTLVQVFGKDELTNVPLAINLTSPFSSNTTASPTFGTVTKTLTPFTTGVLESNNKPIVDSVVDFVSESQEDLFV
jgi:hypothetical protein